MCGMRSVGAILSAAILGAGGLLLLPAPSATAEPSVCSPGVVVDQAGVLDDAKVAAAASAFGRNVVVKVITFTRTPAGGSLFHALKSGRSRCHGWGFHPNGTQSLLVLGLSVNDRAMGSHYDGAAFDVFDATRDHAELDGMGPNFGNGDWTTGMVAGLKMYARAYRASAAAPASSDTGDAGAADPGSSSEPASDRSSGSVSGQTVAWLLGVPVGLTGVGGGVFAGMRLRRRRKAVATARAELSSATDEMAAAWIDLDSGQEYIDAHVGKLPAVADSAVERIRTAHAAAKTSLETATARYLEVSTTYATDKVAGLDGDAATAGLAPVRQTTETLRQAKVAMTAVDDAVSQLEALRAELPGRVAALRTQAADVTRLLESRRAEGYMTAAFDPAPAAAEAAATQAEELPASSGSATRPPPSRPPPAT